jgi:hypothetical protein
MKRLAILFSVLILAACETQLSVPRYAEITFKHRPPIELDVAEIRIVEGYRNSTAPPHVETEFPVPPMRMARRWAEDRLVAVGTEGVLTYTIVDARVVEEPLEKTTGLTGMVTVDQSERYMAKLVVEMSGVKFSPRQTASATTAVERSRTVAEDVTLNERETVWYKMTETMAADLDAQLEAAVGQYFGNFVK